jgi:arylsulfatase A
LWRLCNVSKLLEFFEDNRLELYNVRLDVGETQNLALQKPALARSLHQKLIKWRESIKAQMPTPNPEYDPKAVP